MMLPTTWMCAAAAVVVADDVVVQFQHIHPIFAVTNRIFGVTSVCAFFCSIKSFDSMGKKTRTEQQQESLRWNDM